MRKETALARRREIEVEQMERGLISVRLVGTKWFEILRALRDRLMLVPDRLAEVLAAESNPDVVRTDMEKEIRIALESVVFDIGEIMTTPASE